METGGGDGKDTSTSAITARVPAYQKSLWREEAEEMNMSLSEYVRVMVQAGRRDIRVEEYLADDGPNETTKKRIRTVIEAQRYPSTNKLLSVIDAEREDIHAAIEELQEDGEIYWQPRQDGFTLSDEIG